MYYRTNNYFNFMLDCSRDEGKDRKFENKDENNTHTDIQILIQKYKRRKTKIVYQKNGLTIFCIIFF